MKRTTSKQLRSMLLPFGDAVRSQVSTNMTKVQSEGDPIETQGVVLAPTNSL